jgi:hypothetical protein
VRTRRHVRAAVALLYRTWRDRGFEPTAQDIATLRAFRQDLLALTATASRLVLRLERRFNGEPEVGEGKWLEWHKGTQGYSQRVNASSSFRGER